LASAPGGGSLLRATAPAQILAFTGTNTGVLAVSTFGKGRMVVVSDDSNLWDSTIDPNYGWNGQWHRLAVNIFKWLLVQPPRLDASVRLTDSGCHFSFRAGATQTIHLQRSTDLITWTDWETLTATGAWQEMLDEEAQMHGRQFYRALLVP
jgi:hypothetical protein